MRRDIYQKLVEWKQNPDRKPLILKGARQVGKTWLLKHFGKSEYNNILYINFEKEKQLRNIFKQDFDTSRILTALQIASGIQASAMNTLIILDEIQEAEGGISSLKYFNEEANEFHIVAAGSYLGISLHAKESFPVGKVEILELYPLNFLEFLNATDNNSLRELIENKQWNLISTFKTKFIQLLKEYYFVGGMPEVINHYLATKDFKKIREIQNNLISAYSDDFSKHAPKEIIPRICMVWESIPSQLSKENKKFIFGLIKTGARAKEFELAIEWLKDSGLLYKVTRVKKAAIPINAYRDQGAFKAFFLDIGLLGALADLDALSIIQGNKIFEEFKGALSEQYVFQQLKINTKEIYYWSAEKSTGEIDFLIQQENRIIPIEVKAEENLKAKSLKFFQDKYKIDLSLRFSMSDYREESWLTNVPLYAISTIIN